MTDLAIGRFTYNQIAYITHFALHEFYLCLGGIERHPERFRRLLCGSPNVRALRQSKSLIKVRREHLRWMPISEALMVKDKHCLILTLPAARELMDWLTSKENLPKKY